MVDDSSRPFEGLPVVLGVTGGIAAYKSVLLARLLVKDGADVHAVLTRGARHMIGPATFAGITGNPVPDGLWDRPEDVPHVTMAREADLVIVAPASAHLIARAAHGLADDLLTNILLMARCQVLFAPAMHTEMWEHPATRSNIATLRDRGVETVGPGEGELAGGDEGVGRMSEPEEIHEAARSLVADGRELVGRTVVVTAGGTREHLDPVRFLGNRSSGRMGYAIARAAARRGARVHLVSAPTLLDPPPGVDVHEVVSAREMKDAVESLYDGADVIVKAAAVADFRPSREEERKLKKAAGTPEVVLERNPDILAELGERRENGHPILVGFAAETERAEERGQEKLERKSADLIVVNDVSRVGSGFEVETNQVLILGRDGRRVEVPLVSKDEVAGRVWDEVARLLT